MKSNIGMGFNGWVDQMFGGLGGWVRNFLRCHRLRLRTIIWCLKNSEEVRGTRVILVNACLWSLLVCLGWQVSNQMVIHGEVSRFLGTLLSGIVISIAANQIALSHQQYGMFQSSTDTYIELQKLLNGDVGNFFDRLIELHNLQFNCLLAGYLPEERFVAWTGVRWKNSQDCDDYRKSWERYKIFFPQEKRFIYFMDTICELKASTHDIEAEMKGSCRAIRFPETVAFWCSFVAGLGGWFSMIPLV